MNTENKIKAEVRFQMYATQSCSMVRVGRHITWCIPQNLEVSVGAARVSMDSALGKW